MGANIPEVMKESKDDNLHHTEELYHAYHGYADGRIEIRSEYRQAVP